MPDPLGVADSLEFGAAAAPDSNGFGQQDGFGDGLIVGEALGLADAEASALRTEPGRPRVTEATLINAALSRSRSWSSYFLMTSSTACAWFAPHGRSGVRLETTHRDGGETRRPAGLGGPLDAGGWDGDGRSS